MAMSRKNYEAFAKTIKSELSGAESHEQLAMRQLVFMLAKDMEEDSPRFDIAVFMSDCGIWKD